MDYCEYQSPLGTLLLGATERGLSGVWFQGQKHFGIPGVSLSRNNVITLSRHPYLDAARQWLDQYFSGKIPSGNVTIDLSAGSQFQQAVWREIAKIPYGQTITYGDIARAVGRPRGAQAVGQAVGRNPVSIIVPCHRVMGANGAITGYAAGIHVKQALLDLESVVSC